MADLEFCENGTKWERPLPSFPRPSLPSFSSHLFYSFPVHNYSSSFSFSIHPPLHCPSLSHFSAPPHYPSHEAVPNPAKGYVRARQAPMCRQRRSLWVATAFYDIMSLWSMFDVFCRRREGGVVWNPLVIGTGLPPVSLQSLKYQHPAVPENPRTCNCRPLLLRRSTWPPWSDYRAWLNAGRD